MTTFENVEMNVEDIDLTLRSQIVQRIKREVIAAYGKIKVGEEEFRGVYDGVKEDIVKCICEYYGMSKEEFWIPDGAEAWYDAYRKYYG